MIKGYQTSHDVLGGGVKIAVRPGADKQRYATDWLNLLVVMMMMMMMMMMMQWGCVGCDNAGTRRYVVLHGGCLYLFNDELSSHPLHCSTSLFGFTTSVSHTAAAESHRN